MESYRRPRWRRFGLRLVLMSLLWLALNGSDAGSWIIGLPTVIAAAAVNFPFLPKGAWHFKIGGVIPILWYFFKESYRGAFDIARRALSPRLPIEPGFLKYECRLSNASARIFFADIVSLMPGTLGARADDRHMVIHALDVKNNVESGLRELEAKITTLFGDPVRQGDRR